MELASLRRCDDTDGGGVVTYRASGDRASWGNLGCHPGPFLWSPAAMGLDVVVKCQYEKVNGQHGQVLTVRSVAAVRSLERREPRLLRFHLFSQPTAANLGLGRYRPGRNPCTPADGALTRLQGITSRIGGPNG